MMGAVGATLVLIAAAVMARHQNVTIRPQNATAVETRMTTLTAAPSLSSDGTPDSALTPGAIITSDTAVVCRPGYATRIRPEGKLWAHLKMEAYERYRVPRGRRSMADQNGVREAAYQVDHLIPLELGGSPTDIRNIWPQPIGAAEQKDGVENELHDLVCSGQMSLPQAQRAIAHDWKTAVPAQTLR